MREQRKHPPTLDEIARICGVSRQTVHVALSGRTGVSEERRRRILEVVRRHRPPARRHAGRLPRTAGRQVAVSVPDIRDPFNAELVRGIQDVLHVRGMSMIFVEARDPAYEIESIRALSCRPPAGLILVPLRGESWSRCLRSLTAEHIPIVSVGAVPGFTLPYVEVGNLQIGSMAAACLLDRGHRRLCHLEGPEGDAAGEERTLGFIQCLRERGMRFTDAMLAAGGDTIESGRAAARLLLADEAGRRPTGLVCFNEPVAVGVYETARELGFNIPGDVSVIGCDDAGMARWMHPPLTTLAAPARKMGAGAAEMLFARFDAAVPGMSARRFPPVLTDRASLGFPPQNPCD